MRVPVALFAVLALATVGAFYLTQHLKVQNPLINGSPRVDPAVINPRDAGFCVDANGDRRSFRGTRIAFYLQSRSDTVSVTVHDGEGDPDPLATMAGSNRHYAAGPTHYDYFAWNGRLTDGAYAPAGRYTFFVTLFKQGRNFEIPGQSVLVRSARPTPRVTQVTVGAGPAAKANTTPSFAPGHETVTLDVRTGADISADVLVYRASASRSAPLRLVKRFSIGSRHHTAGWDGTIRGLPAPAGTYLLGLAVTDDSCTRGQFPQTLDPAPETTSGAGVNVSYLSADPPMAPVAAGQVATVPVVAADGRYTWTLRSAGHRTIIDRSHGSSRGTLRVRLPAAGLYELRVASEGHSTTVPLVASGVGPRAAAKVLVVLPALSWQGANATDDDSDGLIDTLSDGSQVSLERPLVAGLPNGVGDEASLLRFLTAQGYRYDVTTDVALAEGDGPTLTGRTGVILDGTFSWLPTQLISRLGQFVTHGGGVFADGIHSLQSTALIADGNYGPVAGPARRTARDPFGVTHGAVAASDGQSILEFADALNIFSSAAALAFPRYQVLEPPHGRVATVAGVAETSPAVIGFHRGTGTVVEVGLANFGSSLASDVDSGELLSRVWQVVLR